MKLSEIIKNIDYEIVGKFDDKEIKGISFDSRKIARNDLFFDLKKGGEKTHCREAYEKGAALIVTEGSFDDMPGVRVGSARRAMAMCCAEFYDHPERKLRIYGVTGTNGKTSVSGFLYQCYRALGFRSAWIGTLGAFVDGERIETGMTTPDAPELYSIFDRCVKKNVTHLIMEVSAHAAYFDKVYHIPFQCGVFTNLTPDHLDFFGNMSSYGDAKKKWLVDPFVNVAVLNENDPLSRSVFDERKKKTVFFAVERDKRSKAWENEKTIQYVAKDTETKGLISFNLLVEGQQYRVNSSLSGAYNIENLLAAGAVLLSDGIDPETTANLLSSVSPIPGRFDRRVCGEKTVVIDYAHTPDGLEKVLRSAREICAGNLWCVFGCGGNRDVKKRPVMGRIAAETADRIVLTSDNPRFEDPDDIIDDVEKGIDESWKNKVVRIPDRGEAIVYAVRNAGIDDVVVIAGKGAENYMEIGGRKIPYSDYDVIKTME